MTLKKALYWFREYWRYSLNRHDPKSPYEANRVFTRYFSLWIRTPLFAIGYQRCYPVAYATGLWTGWNFSLWPSFLFKGFNEGREMYVWTWTTRQIELSELEVKGMLDVLP